MAPLTIRQMKVLAYMRWFQARNDNMPTAALLGLKFGISRSGAEQTIQALVAKGHLAPLEGMRGHRFVDRRAKPPEEDPSTLTREEDDITVELFRECLRVQPDNPWVLWDGQAGCPVPPGRSIEVRFRDTALECIDALAAQRMRWRHAETGGDIIAYRLR